MPSTVPAALAQLADPARAELSQGFFAVAPEHDRFLGIPVPAQRRVARAFADLPLDDLAGLLADRVHEHRFTALVILVARHRRKRTTDAERAGLERFYLDHRAGVDHWDLVDVSAPDLAGTAPRATLDALVASDLWHERRIAMIATFAHIRRGELDTTYALAERLVGDDHHLLHKATGWMLREAGKRDEPRLVAWLEQHVARMPSVMLSYVMEKLEPEERARIRALR